MLYIISTMLMVHQNTKVWKRTFWEWRVVGLQCKTRAWFYIVIRPYTLPVRLNPISNVNEKRGLFLDCHSPLYITSSPLNAGNVKLK